MTALTPEQREEYHRLAVECLTIYNPDDPEAKVARYALDQTAKLEAALDALTTIRAKGCESADGWAGCRALAEVVLPASLPAAPAKTADEAYEPIETAPKDGRWILGKTPNGNLVKARWIGENEADSEYGAHEWGNGTMRVRLVAWKPYRSALKSPAPQDEKGR